MAPVPCGMCPDCAGLWVQGQDEGMFAATCARFSRYLALACWWPFGAAGTVPGYGFL